MAACKSGLLCVAAGRRFLEIVVAENTLLDAAAGTRC
jgi:hypothetical protein